MGAFVVLTNITGAVFVPVTAAEAALLIKRAAEGEEGEKFVD